MSRIFRSLIYFLILFELVISVDQFLPRALFDLHFLSMGNCPETGTKELNFDFHLEKKTKKRTNLVGKSSVKVPLDDNVKLEMTFDKWGKSGWRLSLFHFKQEKACQALKEFLGDVFDELLKYCNEGECLKKKINGTTCPVFKGVYEYADFDIKGIENFNLPTAPTGKWRFSVKFINRKSNIVMGCARVVTIVEAKKAPFRI